MAIARHIYPGNNTPQGFYSYYQYILGQREANRIVCIKGGPGSGKSTFMKKIGEEFLDRGEDVDFMHCSSDNNSLDGIVLKEKKIAFIDATSPHAVDPVNPGAVESIIHLGDYWNEENIRENKNALIENNENIKRWFGRGYNYLAAAEKIYDNIAAVYDITIESAEIYKIAARIVGDELSHREISLNPGIIKKYFASAITPTGFENQIKTLLKGCKKVYLISGPVGASSERILNIFAEGAVYRGYDVEEYFCPLKPDTKIEHLIVPELSLAFITTNAYHDIEPWEIAGSVEEQCEYPKINLLDMNDFVEVSKQEALKPFVDKSNEIMKMLLEKAIECIGNAKKGHDVLESYYIPNMDFKKIDAIRDEIIAKISQ